MFYTFVLVFPRFLLRLFIAITVRAQAREQISVPGVVPVCPLVTIVQRLVWAARRL